MRDSAFLLGDRRAGSGFRQTRDVFEVFPVFGTERVRRFDPESESFFGHEDFQFVLIHLPHARQYEILQSSRFVEYALDFSRVQSGRVNLRVFVHHVDDGFFGDFFRRDFQIVDKEILNFVYRFRPVATGHIIEKQFMRPEFVLYRSNSFSCGKEQRIEEHSRNPVERFRSVGRCFYHEVVDYRVRACGLEHSFGYFFSHAGSEPSRRVTETYV